MQEEIIATKLKENIPSSPPQESVIMHNLSTGEIDHSPVDFRLDEITAYKLAQHFDEQYSENRIRENDQYNYIYNTVAEQLGTSDYTVVVAKINDLLRMLGLNHTENKRFKLYQWLKLDQKRTNIEREQDNLRHE